MKATVTFACDCQQAHVEALIERATDGAEAGRLLFGETGRKSVALPSGAYDVAYRAQGTPWTAFSLKVVEGGSMRNVDRVMPSEGQAAGVRRLLVVARLLLLPLLVFRPAAAALAAQTPSERRVAAEERLATVPNVADVLQPGSYLAVEAGADSTSGTGTIAVENGAGSFSGAVSLTGPLDSASATKLPRKLDGLSNSGTIKAAVHWFHWPANPDVDAMARVCEQALGRDDCDDDELSGADRRRFVRLAHSGDAPIVLTIHASMARERFEYADPKTLASASEVRTNWGTGFGAGRYVPRFGYTAVEFEAQERFDNGRSTNRCDIGNAGGLECGAVIVEAPIRRRLAIGGLEWRLFLNGGTLAINPSVSRDFRNRVFAVDFPFYFLRLSSSKSGGLAGGARASWRSDTHDLAVALFLGAALHPTP